MEILDSLQERVALLGLASWSFPVVLDARESPFDKFAEEGGRYMLSGLGAI